MLLKLRPLHDGFSAFSPVYMAVTWFQAGRIRPASGSWGTLAAIPFCWLIRQHGGNIGLAVFTVLVGLIGWLAVKAYARKTDNPDPSEVVIDEVMGMAIVGLMIPFAAWWWFFGFILFRIFDSIKRGPVGWCDRKVKGPFGVMLDDVAAAVIAGGILFGLSLLIR